MTFRLHIPGRDDPLGLARANTANPLMIGPAYNSSVGLAIPADGVMAPLTVTISGLAKLAVLDCSGTAASAAIPSLPASLSKYTQSTVMLPPDAAAAVETERVARRHARIVWLGYVKVVDELNEILTERDRRLDDRRLCVECAHAGPGWHCRMRQGFLTGILRRCEFFAEGLDP